MAGRFLGKTPDINYLIQDFLFSHQHALKFETVGLKHKAGECTLRIHLFELNLSCCITNIREA